jgi:hypothetical protein
VERVDRSAPRTGRKCDHRNPGLHQWGLHQLERSAIQAALAGSSVGFAHL